MLCENVVFRLETTRVKCEVHPIAGHESLEGEQKCGCDLSLTSALDGGVAPAVLPPGITYYPLCRRLGRPTAGLDRCAKSRPTTGIRSPDRQPRSSVAIPTELPGPYSTFLPIGILTYAFQYL